MEHPFTNLVQDKINCDSPRIIKSGQNLRTHSATWIQHTNKGKLLCGVMSCNQVEEMQPDNGYRDCSYALDKDRDCKAIIWNESHRHYILAAHVAIFMDFGVIWRTCDVTSARSSWAVDITAGIKTLIHRLISKAFKQQLENKDSLSIPNLNNCLPAVSMVGPELGLCSLGYVSIWSGKTKLSHSICGHQWGPSCSLPTHLLVGLVLLLVLPNTAS